MRDPAKCSLQQATPQMSKRKINFSSPEDQEPSNEDSDSGIVEDGFFSDEFGGVNPAASSSPAAAAAASGSATPEPLVQMKDASITITIMAIDSAQKKIDSLKVTSTAEVMITIHDVTVFNPFTPGKSSVSMAEVMSKTASHVGSLADAVISSGGSLNIVGVSHAAHVCVNKTGCADVQIVSLKLTMHS